MLHAKVSFIYLIPGVWPEPGFDWQLSLQPKQMTNWANAPEFRFNEPNSLGVESIVTLICNWFPRSQSGNWTAHIFRKTALKSQKENKSDVTSGLHFCPKTKSLLRCLAASLIFCLSILQTPPVHAPPASEWGLVRRCACEPKAGAGRNSRWHHVDLPPGPVCPSPA